MISLPQTSYFHSPVHCSSPYLVKARLENPVHMAYSSIIPPYSAYRRVTRWGAYREKKNNVTVKFQEIETRNDG